MATLHDVIAYLCFHYPTQSDLSKTRLTKLVYLSDWRSAITRGKQLTPIEWVYNHYGPYVPDVVETAHTSGDFETIADVNMFGDQKEIIRVRIGATYPGLSEDDRAVLDHVIQKTATKNWSEFIRLVYSTYPIVTQEKYTHLDLIALAHEYKEDKEEFDWGEAFPFITSSQ